MRGKGCGLLLLSKGLEFMQQAERPGAAVEEGAFGNPPDIGRVIGTGSALEVSGTPRVK